MLVYSGRIRHFEGNPVDMRHCDVIEVLHWVVVGADRVGRCRKDTNIFGGSFLPSTMSTIPFKPELGIGVAGFFVRFMVMITVLCTYKYKACTVVYRVVCRRTTIQTVHDNSTLYI